MPKSGIAKWILRIRIRMIVLLLAAVAVTILYYEFFASPSFSHFIQDCYTSIGNVLRIINEVTMCSALAIIFVQTQ